MSQGLTWIAGRRTPLLALVALLRARQWACSAALQIPRAQHDCSADCSIITMGFPGSCEVVACHVAVDSRTSRRRHR